MITAVCLNPSFDKTVTVSGLKVGEVNRVQKIHQEIGGKGINVGITLSALGGQAACLGFLAENNADSFMKELCAFNVEPHFVPVDGVIRVNTKLIDQANHTVTEINEQGPSISTEEQTRFFQLLQQRTESDDLFVFSGRLPANLPMSFYQQCLHIVKGRRCILDTSDESLLLALSEEPYLIKPNNAELEQMMGCSLPTRQDIITAAHQLMNKGAQNVLVSMGKKGAILVSQKKNYFASPVEVPVISTVGAGDTMVAGFTMAISKALDFAEALRYGTAAAAACIMSESTCLHTNDVFNQLLKKTDVVEL